MGLGIELKNAVVDCVRRGQLSISNLYNFILHGRNCYVNGTKCFPYIYIYIYTIID